ncbi:MAG: HAD-IA family hydrolase [Deltaproteobacteria bacterium]|nr:HAD-IA family hydrolase [Deltaproteobacteria bacterium]
MAHPIRTVLFDLDGTLLDSIELILGGFREMMRRHHGEVPQDDVWLRGIGTPLAKQIAELATDAEQAEAMRETFAAYNVANHDAFAGPYSGVTEVVETLHAAGINLGIVTSKRRIGAFRGLRRMGMTDWFGAVVAADDVERPKPHAQPVHQALDLLGADAASAVFIGDSTHDMESGRAAGVRTGAVLWGPFTRASLAVHEPTWWFDHPDELLSVLMP